MRRNRVCKISGLHHILCRTVPPARIVWPMAMLQIPRRRFPGMHLRMYHTRGRIVVPQQSQHHKPGIPFLFPALDS